MKTCSKCEMHKSDTSFRKAGRGLRRVCIECEDGVNTTGSEKPAKEKDGPTPRTFEIPATYGVRMTLDKGLLILEQDGQTDDGQAKVDNITLSSHEAARLIEQIQEWIEAAA